MLRTIERYERGLIQKVYGPKDKLIGYQAVKEAGNAEGVTRCSSLSAAREALGVKITPPVKLTKPKMEMPQNQPGYKAPSR